MSENTNNNWRFCVTGNIIEKHCDSDGNIFYGTKAFRGGTKVYINDKHLGPESTDAFVIGMNRFKRYVFDVVPLDLIENVRLQRVFKPQILQMIEHDERWEGGIWRERTADDRKGATAFVEQWQKKYKR